MRTLLLLLSCLLASATIGFAATPLSYVDLVKRLNNLEALSILPVPGETSAQWSSYDRASTYDAATGKYVSWDANVDGGGVIRREGEQVVMAEMTGPGCIVRIWSASVGGGHVKIYLDGATEPTVDLPFRDYFSGKVAPFNYPALVHMTARGINNYVPIPYQRSCKIVADKGWGNYYHFNYVTFPQGTVVPTFTMNRSAADLAALQVVNDMMTTGLGSDPAGTRPGGLIDRKTLTLAPGQTTTAVSLNGQRAITSLTIQLDKNGIPDMETALRAVTLSIKWDGEAHPSVWAPVGDFFGTAPRFTPYKSLPLGITEHGGYSFWYMPFAKSAQVGFTNDGTVPVTLTCTVTHAPVTAKIETLGRFHAKWHRDAFLPTEPERAIDWTMLKTTGRGRFCGVALHLWNPIGGWWGEGDEKFFVDGEKFPSTIGTGSEDYFGYAWCSAELFQNALHNQPLAERDNKNHTSVNRWHTTDNIPFHTGFEGAIEKYYRNKRPCVYDAVVYWYQDAASADPYPIVPFADRIGYYALPYQVDGAIEAEQLKVSQKTGEVGGQVMDRFTGEWSLGTQLWWRGGKPGDTLILNLPVKEAGTYQVQTQLTKAGDYGIVQFAIDDQQLGTPIDCFNRSVIPTGALTLGQCTLTAGDHQLKVTITGKNAQSSNYLIGVDYVKLVPVK